MATQATVWRQQARGRSSAGLRRLELPVPMEGVAATRLKSGAPPQAVEKVSLLLMLRDLGVPYPFRGQARCRHPCPVPDPGMWEGLPQPSSARLSVWCVASESMGAEATAQA